MHGKRAAPSPTPRRPDAPSIFSCLPHGRREQERHRFPFRAPLFGDEAREAERRRVRRPTARSACSRAQKTAVAATAEEAHATAVRRLLLPTLQSPSMICHRSSMPPLADATFLCGHAQRPAFHHPRMPPPLHVPPTPPNGASPLFSWPSAWPSPPPALAHIFLCTSIAIGAPALGVPFASASICHRLPPSATVCFRPRSVGCLRRARGAQCHVPRHSDYNRAPSRAGFGVCCSCGRGVSASPRVRLAPRSPRPRSPRPRSPRPRFRLSRVSASPAFPPRPRRCDAPAEPRRAAQRPMRRPTATANAPANGDGQCASQRRRPIATAIRYDIATPPVLTQAVRERSGAPR